VREAFAVAGALAIAAAWAWVATGRSTVLRVLPALHLVLGLATIVILGSDLSLGSAASLAAGAGSGLVLYGATLAFVALVEPWEPFRRHVAGAYAEADTEPLGRRLVLALAVSVPGEELFLRGLLQPRLSVSIAPWAAAAATVAVEVVVNLPSRRLPIVAAALVGGAVWSGLAWWSGGVLAPIASHVVWTGLMLVRPPAAGGEMMRA
jgi:membrane protease YdiL (CAAX protease family)